MKLLLGIITLLLVGGAAWYLGSPLFLDETVNEPLPFTDITQQDYEDMEEMAAELELALPAMEDMKEMTQQEKEALETDLRQKGEGMSDVWAMEDMPNQTSSTNEPEILSLGAFIGADNFHTAAGDAKILKLADGSHVLRLEDFNVTNGPDLRVLLARHGAPETRDEVDQGYIELGKIKGNKGNQNYDIPLGTDLNMYKSVVIYCKPFHVVFTSATLAN